MHIFFSGYHLTQTYFPSIVFVIVAWVSFFVPSDVVPGRMVLCVTTLLTLTSMFNSVRWVWYHAENLKKGLIHIENYLLHKYTWVQNVDAPNWLLKMDKSPIFLTIAVCFDTWFLSLQKSDSSSFVHEGNWFVGICMHALRLFYFGRIWTDTLFNQSECLAEKNW